MKLDFYSKIKDGRQDGAISNGFLFSFNHQGVCTVYEMQSLKDMKDGEAEIFAEFVLDQHDAIVPHSNSVMFGNEYFDEQDEFPLLYTNIYNNYAKSEDALKGVCLVYRLQRNERIFSSTLVQMIEIGFVEDESLWKSGKTEDVRPYGNFTLDTEQGILHAFTMRDESKSTRYFSFDLPKAAQGELCETYHVKRVVLGASDIRGYFDCPYHHFVQGTCCHNGKIYSLEGFTDHADNPPAIRVIDTKQRQEIYCKKFSDFGTNIEPEMIDFECDAYYYTDHHGNMYTLLMEDE